MKRAACGIVMEINSKSAVVMTKTGEFLKVKKPAHEFSIGDEITSTVFEETDRLKYMAAAAVLVLLLTPFIYLKQAYATVAYVNIDINPSLEVGINKYNRVNTATPLNEDGKTLLENLSLKGLDIRDAVDKVINSAKDMGYIKDDSKNNIEIALIKLDKKDHGISENTLKEYAQNTISKSNIDANVQVHNADKNIHDKAMKENMSTNKYLDKIRDEKVRTKDSDKKDSTKDINEKAEENPKAGNSNNHTDNNKAKAGTPESKIEKYDKSTDKIEHKPSEDISKDRQNRNNNGKDNGGKK